MSERLRIENLRKRIGGFELQASFEVEAGQRSALIGRSGMGKTSLLRLIAGLEPLSRGDSGRIFLGDEELTHLAVQKRKIAFVFQEQALFTGRSIFENVSFGLRMQGQPASALGPRVRKWLAKLGLSGRGSEKVDHLSGGERQRVALARAWITEPRLILMDEPFTGLDAALRDSLCDELLKLHAENPVPLLFVSHDERDLARLATGRIVFEENGTRRLAVRV